MFKTQLQLFLIIITLGLLAVLLSSQIPQGQVGEGASIETNVRR